jgi:hypothetical protein
MSFSKLSLLHMVYRYIRQIYREELVDPTAEEWLPTYYWEPVKF